ncbi:hypothetical protein O181_005163 [Austropuccinia psidii MF-1]|uniref:Tc1-like transposase DDE domain-containing protein n=1 Tax=Austropuccinia psidii MF-1 TaxID=1389203 RepID=A0A9Q3BI01_9BASI|nr:hypothetical protein [Austropuccinia psidii MF-1]
METAPWIMGFHKLIIMEDNTPIHTENLSNQLFEEHCINKMIWPAHSPDLNPIENIWKKMKSSIFKLYQPQSVQELEFAIQSACEDAPWALLDDLLLLLPHQMEMVIAMNGGPTSY